jgi:hypothetical protein
MLLDSLNEKEIMSLAIKIAEKAPRNLFYLKGKRLRPNTLSTFGKCILITVDMAIMITIIQDPAKPRVSLAHITC